MKNFGKIVVSNDRNLKSSTAKLRKFAGASSLAALVRSDTGGLLPKPGTVLSKLNPLENEREVQRIAELTIDNVDGALSGKQIAREINDAINDTAEMKSVFKSSFSLYVEGLDKSAGYGVKDTPGNAFSSSDIAPSQVITERSNDSLNNLGHVPRPKGTYTDPGGLTIFTSKKLNFTPASRFIAPFEIFAGGIPTHEFSRCVPYLDVVFQNHEQTVDSDTGAAVSLSLAKSLVGGKKLTGPGKEMANATSRDLDLSNRSRPEKFKVNSQFGMEMFTSPQTLRPLTKHTGGGSRPEDILDPSRPLMSIQSFEVSQHPQGDGFYVPKIGSMRIIMHDRSRLHEIAPLIRPENYSTNEVYVEYGWSHPDAYTGNEYGKFLNSLRMREKYKVANSTFNFTRSGEVEISLDLVLAGQLAAHNTTIIDSSTMQPLEKIATAAANAVLTHVKKIGNEKKNNRKVLTSTQYVTKHMVDATNFFVPASFDQIVANLSSITAETAKKDSEALLESIEELKQEMYTFSTQKQALVDRLTKMCFGVSSIDPFKVTPNSQPASFENGRYDIDEMRMANANVGPGGPGGDKVSVGKLISLFVGRPMESTGLYDEVQLFFYNFASESGYNGALSAYNIAEFEIDREDFLESLSTLMMAKGTASISINQFMSHIIKTFIQYTGATQAGAIPDAHIEKTLQERRTGSEGTQSAVARKVGKDSAQNDAAIKKALSAHNEAITNYGIPQINYYFEALPGRTPPSEGVSARISNSQAQQRTILRMHIFDKHLGKQTAIGQLVGAATENLETLKKVRAAQAKVGQFLENTLAATPIQTVADQYNSEINDLVKQVEDLKRTNPGLKVKFDDKTERYTLNMDFTELKKVISQNYPTVVFGSSNSALTDATFSSIRDSDFKNLQLIRQGRAPDKTPTGKDPSGLPIKVQPTNLRVSMLGCPLTYYGQSLFFDFNTGTSVDDVYYVQTIQHSIRPGEFNTNLTLSTRDSDGKFESLLNTLSSARKTIDEAKGTLGEITTAYAIKPS
jgi:hypothetical protein